MVSRMGRLCLDVSWKDAGGSTLSRKLMGWKRWSQKRSVHVYPVKPKPRDWDTEHTARKSEEFPQDEQQKVRTITALALAALAEAGKNKPFFLAEGM